METKKDTKEKETLENKLKKVERCKCASAVEKRHAAEIILDVKIFFTCKCNYFKNQSTIGIKSLLTGVLMKEWVVRND